MKWLILLLGCSTCFAQFPYSGTTWKAPNSSSIVTPGQISGLRYWFHYPDNPTNVNVTNWISEVGVSIWTNGADSLRPTNSSTGVGFNGSTWLSNTAPFILVTSAASTGSVYLVMAQHASAGSLGGIIADNTGGGKGIYATSGHQIKLFMGAGSGTVCDFVDDNLFDMAMTLTNNGTSRNWFWTNNIFINNFNFGDFGTACTFIGQDALGNKGKQKLRDIMVFYGGITSLDISNLHKWSTNTYNFAP